MNQYTIPPSCRIFAALFRKIYDLLRRRIGRVWYTLPSRFAKNSSQIYGNLPPSMLFMAIRYTVDCILLSRKTLVPAYCCSWL